jgi:hypothetical protein
MSIFVPIVFGDDRGMRLAGEAAEGHARAWIDDIRLGHLGSFPEIAAREDQGERHIRLLPPLAFWLPRIVAAIADARVPADLAVTGWPKPCGRHTWPGAQGPRECSLPLLEFATTSSGASG